MTALTQTLPGPGKQLPPYYKKPVVHGIEYPTMESSIVTRHRVNGDISKSTIRPPRFGCVDGPLLPRQLELCDVEKLQLLQVLVSGSSATSTDWIAGTHSE
jgi:hypothetical protein